MIDGETVFVQLAASTYFSLDAVGTRMLEGVLSAASVAEALPALQREFEAEPAAIESDLLGLLQELRAAGLIEIVTPS